MITIVLQMQGIGLHTDKRWLTMNTTVSNNQGSTLIEVLVSMIIIAVTALGSIALYFNSSEIKGMAMHKKMAVELVNSQMEEFRSDSWTCASIIAWLGADDDQWLDYSVGGLDLLGSNGKGIKTHVDPDPDSDPSTDYCEVEISIKWNEVGQANRDFDVNLATYRTP